MLYCIIILCCNSYYICIVSEIDIHCHNAICYVNVVLSIILIILCKNLFALFESQCNFAMPILYYTYNVWWVALKADHPLFDWMINCVILNHF